MAKKVQQPGKSGKPKSDTLTPVVVAISELQFQGAVIPHSWWLSDRLRYDSGRANPIAALILADICYWYRATEKRDEAGNLVARQKRFQADKLRKSYSEWADLFGVTKRQVQNAVAFLVDRGLITRELRIYQAGDGRRFNNATFFEPVIDAVRAITFDTLTLSEVTPSHF